MWQNNEELSDGHVSYRNYLNNNSVLILLRGQSWRRQVPSIQPIGSIPPLEELEEMKYLILSYLRSGVEAKRSIQYRHSTRNALIIRRKLGSGVPYH